MNEFIENFQFLRPWWLLAMPFIVFIVYWRVRQIRTAGWAGHIAPDKLPHLALSSSSNSPLRQWLLIPPLLLACVALAGPGWQSLPGSVAGNRQAMVILLDLSPSMLAQDLKPTRLEHASLKLIDLLSTRTDGDTALIAYAGDAHRVSPLTDDPATIASLVKTLHPNIMPISGSQPELAVELALSLFTGAELALGDIVLITDGMHAQAAATIKSNLPQGYRLSILGVGSTSGAPIPIGNAGFMRNTDEQIIIATLNDDVLRDLATQSGGRYHRVTADSSDIDYLSALSRLPFSARVMRDVQPFDSTHDAGYWLVLLLLPLAAYLFRRHLLWVLMPLAFIPADSHAWSWSELWHSNDQQAAKALQMGQPARAAKLFDTPQWAAVARYRQGEYALAAEMFASEQSADGYYNAGNAQALAGELEAAVATYARTLALEPAHEDARYNREFLLTILRQREDERELSEEEQNRRGSGEGESEGESSAADSQDMAAAGGEQQQVGGAAGVGQSLSQQTLQEGGQSSSSSGEQEPGTDGVTNATAVQQPGAITSRDIDEGTTANSDAVEITDSQRAVLTPYSEQWLRTLPKDPGGYLRRKFEYQSHMRLQENGGEMPVLQEGRY